MYNLDNFDIDSERQALGIISTETTRGRKKFSTKTNSVQAGLPDDWTRATFIVRIELLNKIKDFVYTERISIKEALDVALERFFQDTTGLLPHNRERSSSEEIIRLDGEKTYGIKEVAAILNRALALPSVFTIIFTPADLKPRKSPTPFSSPNLIYASLLKQILSQART